ncbi:MAG: hypothetical protein V2I46_07715 [Bacteroides sp.]|jgi:hypothetical protein|nr:hypothetical protein [Bacteroides sp.]
MQPQRFLELINHPEKLDKTTLEPLRELARRYPYSQPIRFLLARNLQELKHPDFEQQVNVAAASAFDRRHFQAFLSGRVKPIQATIPDLISTAERKARPDSLSARILSWFSKKEKTKPEKTGTPIEKPEEVQPPATPEAGNNDTPNPQNSQAFPQRKHNELIDRFLKEEPRIRPRRDPSNDENLAEKNLLSPEDIGTETLAAIFLKQGLHEKALDIYQKLSLKFPEKSSYFAEKINSIKNDINLKK